MLLGLVGLESFSCSRPQEDLNLLAGVDADSASELEFPNGEEQQEISVKEVGVKNPVVRTSSHADLNLHVHADAIAINTVQSGSGNETMLGVVRALSVSVYLYCSSRRLSGALASRGRG